MALPALPRALRRDLSKAILYRMAAMVLGIEGIYLADKILTELLAHMLKFGLGIGFLLKALLLAMPEILLLGLPPALFLAAYLALRSKRYAGEMLVLQAAGLGPAAWARYLLVCGAVAGAGAMGVAGWIEPVASTDLRETIRQTRLEAINAPLMVSGQFLILPPVTLYAHGRGADPFSANAAGIFALMERAGGSFDVITAARGQAQFDADTGDLNLRFDQAQLLTFAQGGMGKPLRQPQNLQTSALSVTGITIAMPKLGRPQDAVAGKSLLALWLDGTKQARAEMLRRLLAAGLAVIVPLLAMAALAGRGGILRPAFAMLGVLAAGLGVPVMADWAALLAAGAGIAVAMGAVALICGILYLHVTHAPLRWMAPDRGNP